MKKLLLLVFCMMSFSVVGQAAEEYKLIGYFAESDTKEKTELSDLMNQCVFVLYGASEKNSKDCLKEMGLDPEMYKSSDPRVHTYELVSTSHTIPVKRVRKEKSSGKRIIDSYELEFTLLHSIGRYTFHEYKFRPRSIEEK